MTTTTTATPSIESLTYQLRDLILELSDHDAREIAMDYVYLLTKGDHKELVSAVQEFQQELAERNSDDDED